MVHCLFEQSGTFKNQFKVLGVHAEDYDIQNEFGETDHVVDLFEEIRCGYEGKPSIFDNISKDDTILAFFPCTRFEVQIIMGFKGTMYQFKDWTDEQKLEYDLKLHGELSELYELITKLALIALKRGLKLIIENPYCTQHYLTRYWALEPKWVDENRLLRGDYYKKPTQFFFINCEPQHNFIMEAMPNNAEGMGTIENAHRNTGKFEKNRTTARSMIAPEYANRIIREQILEA